MQRSLRITMRDIPPSDAIARLIRHRAAKLEAQFPRLMGCDVTLESPHRHKTNGRHYRVRIDLAVPGANLVVTRNPTANKDQEDAYATIDAAFGHAERVLKGHLQKHRTRQARESLREPARVLDFGLQPALATAR